MGLVSLSSWQRVLTAEMEDVKSAASALNDRGGGLDFEVSVTNMDDLEEGLESPHDTLMGGRKTVPLDLDDKADARPLGMCGCLTMAFYQPYFDVDTVAVQQRLMRALLPFQKNPEFSQIATAAPDMYGPFWLAVTLILCLASSSNVASFFNFDGDKADWSYDFTRVATACTMVEVFVLAYPATLWGIGKYTGVPMPLAFLFCLYGYSMTIFIPIAFLCMAPLNGLDWVFLLLGMAWSLYFILSNLWRTISDNVSKEKMLTLVGLICGGHLVWTILLKMLFF